MGHYIDAMGLDINMVVVVMEWGGGKGEGEREILLFYPTQLCADL